ncbi:hypothetical protein BB560_003535, partial [Smittium megazygosporum]
MLRNLNLDEEVISEALENLPITAKSGSIGSVKVEITWSNLLSGGCRIEINNLNIVVELLDSNSNMRFPDIAESLFTDGGQSILTSSIFIADDFLKREEGGGINFNGDFVQSPNLAKTLGKKNIENSDKLNFISGVVDKIIFGTDVHINNFSLTVDSKSSSLENSSISPNTTSLVFQFSKFSLENYYTANKNKYMDPSLKTSQTNPVPKPSGGTQEPKYKYVHIEKTVKAILLEGFKVKLNSNSFSSTLLAISGSPICAQFTLYRKLPFSYLEPVKANFSSSDQPSPGMEFAYGDIFEISMPGEFRVVASSPEDSPKSNLVHPLEYSSTPESKSSLEDSSRKEGWEFDLSVDTLTVMLFPETLIQLSSFYQKINDWTKVRSNTLSAINNYYNAHPNFPQPASGAFGSQNINQDLHITANYSSTKVNIKSIKFILLCPPANYVPGSDYFSKLNNWDSETEISNLSLNIKPFKHMLFELQQIDIKYSCPSSDGYSKKRQSKYDTFSSSHKNMSNLNPSFMPIRDSSFLELPGMEKDVIQLSISKASLIDHDPLEDIVDYSLIDFSWDALQDTKNLNIDDSHLRGSIPLNGGASNIFLAPLEINFSNVFLERISKYDSISNYLSSNHTEQAGLSPRKSPSQDDSRPGLSYDPNINVSVNFANSNTGSRIESIHHDDSYDDSDDFIVKKNTTIPFGINDYMNTVKQDADDLKMSCALESKKIISKIPLCVFSPLIRIRLLVPSFNDCFKDYSQNSDEKGLQLEEIRKQFLKLLNLHFLESSNKKIILEWFDVGISGSNYSEPVASPSTNDSADKSSDKTSFSLKLEGGFINVLLDTGYDSEHTVNDNSSNLGNGFAQSSGLVHIASIESLSKDSTLNVHSIPILEIMIQPQNQTSFATRPSSVSKIPRPPALVGLQGKFEHDTKSRRSLDSEKDVTFQYQQRCLTSAEITINFSVPCTKVHLDELKLLEISKFLKIVSLLLAKQQLETENGNQPSNKKLIVLLSNFKKIIVSIENKYKHSLKLEDIETFIVVGLVEEDKTYCHIHSYNLKYEYLDANQNIFPVVCNTIALKEDKKISLPLLSIDYLSTPLLQDLNELVIKIDWSTLEVDNLLPCIDDLQNFFQGFELNTKPNKDLGTPITKLPLGLTEDKKPLNDSNLVDTSSDLSSSQSLESSPLQVFVFIRNISFKYKIKLAKKNRYELLYMPSSIIIGIDTISFLDLLNSNITDNTLEPESIKKQRINVGGISLLTLPSNSSMPTSSPHNLAGEPTISFNPEKHWTSLGYAVMAHISMIDLALNKSFTSAQCELVKLDLHSDSLDIFAFLAKHFSEILSEKKVPKSELLFDPSHSLNVFEDIDNDIFKMGGESGIKSTLGPPFSSIHKFKADIRAESDDHSGFDILGITNPKPNAHEPVKESKTPSANNTYFESEYLEIGHSHARFSMEEYRRMALDHRLHASNDSADSFKYLSDNYKPFGSSMHSANLRNTPLSFSDDETEKIGSDLEDLHFGFTSDSGNDNDDKKHQNLHSRGVDKELSLSNPPETRNFALIDDYFSQSDDSSSIDLKSEIHDDNQNTGFYDKEFTHKLFVGKLQILLFKSSTWSKKSSSSKSGFSDKPQLEVEALNIRLQFNKFVPAFSSEWNMILNVGQFNIYDKIESSQWNKFLTRMNPLEYKKHRLHPMLYNQGFKSVSNVNKPRWMSSRKYADPQLPDILSVCVDAVKHLSTEKDKNVQKILIDGNELVEYRIDVEVAPIRSYIDQDALAFLIDFFSGKFNYRSRIVSAQKGNESRTSNEFKLEPYIQAFSISSTLIKFDYKPKQSSLSSKKSFPSSPSTNDSPSIIELLNLISLEEAVLTLQPVQLYGVEGFPKLVNLASQIWLPHITNKQIPKVVGSLPPLKPFATVGSAAIDLVILPISEYKKNGKWYKGLQSSFKTFAQVSALEAMNVGAKVAINTQTLLEQAGDILNVPTDKRNQSGSNKNLGDSASTLGKKARFPSSKYADQPTSASDGIRQAYKSMSRNITKVTQTILAIPIEDHEEFEFDLEFEVVENPDGFEDSDRDEDDGAYVSFDQVGPSRAYNPSKINNSVKKIVRAVPVAVLNPMIGASEAVSKTLLGLRNTLEKDRNDILEDEEETPLHQGIEPVSEIA